MKFNPEPKRTGVYCWALLDGYSVPEPVFVERHRGKLRVIAFSMSDPIDGDTVTYGDEIKVPEVEE